MKRSLTLTLLLATMLAIAACGESETGQSGRSSPAEPQQTKAESDQQSVPEETAREEATRKRVPANNEAAQNEQGSTRVDDESPGLSVTTLEGEQVNLGGARRRDGALLHGRLVTEVQGGGSDLVRDPSGLRGSWARDANGLHRPVRNDAVHRSVQ